MKFHEKPSGRSRIGGPKGQYVASGVHTLLVSVYY